MGNRFYAIPSMHGPEPMASTMLIGPDLLEYRGRGVPEVLRSGDHGAIEEWRRRDSRKQSSNRSDADDGKDAGDGEQAKREQEPRGVPGEE